MPFDQYVEENILKPLDMRQSTFRQPVPPDLATNVAKGYTYANSAYHVESFVYIQIPPAGSMFTTATDVAKFMIALLQEGQYGANRILQATTARQMRQQLFTNDPRVSGWAYGLMEFNWKGRRVLWDPGGTPLFNSLMVLLPQYGIGMFVAYNSAGGAQAVFPSLLAFLELYDPASDSQPKPLFIRSQDHLGRYAGCYRSAQNVHMTFEKAKTFVQFQINVVDNGDGTLLLTGLGEPLRLQEVEPLVFRPAAGESTWIGDVVFREDSQGRITHLFLQNPPTIVHEKVA